MPTYHIQLRSDTHVRRSREVERDDYKALKVEVARFVGQLLNEHAHEIWTDEEWRVDVTDATGLILYFMQISASETAATMSQPAPGM